MCYKKMVPDFKLKQEKKKKPPWRISLAEF